MVARSEPQRGSKPKTARLLLWKVGEDYTAVLRSTRIFPHGRSRVLWKEPEHGSQRDLQT